MAEAISFGLVRKIIEKLGSTTFDEIGSIWGVKDEFQKLKNTVSTIQAVLQDAEEQQDKNHQVRDWLMKLRDAIYDADDLLSDFSTEDLRQRVMGGDKMAKKNVLRTIQRYKLLNGSYRKQGRTFHILELGGNEPGISSNFQDFEEFFEAAMSVHQLEGRKSGEQHARRAYELFEKDGNKSIMTGGTCSSLLTGKF